MALDLTAVEKHEMLNGLVHLKDSVENLDIPDYTEPLNRIATALEELVLQGQEKKEK